MPRGATFLQLLLAFIGGGLFFSDGLFFRQKGSSAKSLLNSDGSERGLEAEERTAMQRQKANHLNPVRVPSLEDVIAQGSTPNQLRPAESPTLGATAAFSGLNAALQSPHIPAPAELGAIPARLMPPPPRPSTLGTATPGNAKAAAGVVHPPQPPASSSEGVDAAGNPLPLERRASLSPGKRRRAPEDEPELPEPAYLPPSAVAAGIASIGAALGFGGGAPAGASASASGDGGGGDAFEPEGNNDDDDDDDDDDERPASPTKRQARAPAFGQAHMTSGAKAAKAAAAAAKAAPPPQTTVVDMYSPGMLRIPVFRIPSLLTLPNGVCLAFSEARPSLHDAGVIDMVMRRSTDHGLHWSPARVIVEGSMLGAARSATVGNPCAVYDATTQTVWMLLCTNHASDAEWQIHARAGKDSVGRRVWVTSSSDHGKSWARPKEITTDVKQPSWTWYATGPGIGIQLPSGRLLMPCNHAEDVAEHQCPYLPDRKRSRMVAHCVYSDDHGKTWKLGGNAARHTNETTLARLPDGRIVMNSRDWSGRFQRVLQYSDDDGRSWKAPRHDPTLIEPEPQGCHGSMVAAPPVKGVPGATGCLFFCNPSSDRREMLTIRRSDDGGATWCKAFVLEDGPSAYSSMDLTHDGCLGVLYERGGQISFARIPSHADGPLGVFC